MGYPAIITTIASWFSSAANTLYNVHLQCYASFYIPNVIGDLFYTTSGLMSNIASGLYTFYSWTVDVATRLINIITESDIYNYIISFFPSLDDIINWFGNWTSYVWGQITSWWQSVIPTVQQWIEEAINSAGGLIGQLQTWLTNLQQAWDNFITRLPTIDEVLAWFGDWFGQVRTNIIAWWNETVPSLNDWINSTLQEWFPFYDELVSLWADIRLFFVDPLAWVYEKLDEFFERFW